MRANRSSVWTRATAVVLAAAASSGVPLVGQTPTPPPPRDRPVFGVQTSAVLVDVVVRDKKGRLVRDLTANDFEVYEDGARQTVHSFRVVDNGPSGDEQAETAAPATPAPDAAGPKPTPPSAAPVAPTAVAFVFDRLSPSARALAVKTATSYMDHGYVPGDFAAVFAIDLSLHIVQPFTTNPDRVRAAINQAGAQGNTPFANERQDARGHEDTAQRAADAVGALSGGGGTSGSAGALAGVFAVQQLNEQMQANMIRSFDVLEREQQGFATTHALLALVNGLKPLPGRKTLVFFSEGLALTSNVEGQFRSVIASANRANVSVYSVDAAGLRVDSSTRETAQEMRANAQARLRQEESAGLGRLSNEALSRGFERNEDAQRLNPESGLGQLAK
ncbi:MAG TPA: VWA domain-containing protein [Vicinamibacteria bacterium]|nr:VWA domain-containing protein [Vicinamibacteria bacterium]